MTAPSIQMDPIGTIRSCFTDKFGVPRQPGLIKEARGTIELCPPFDREEAVRELSAFSHIWVIFQFHKSQKEDWKPTVRPPRLGGNKKVGVFATRSNFRPNPVGLSVVKLESVETDGGKVRIHISGMDLLDGTPVIDIKPYIPYVDAIEGASGGFAPEQPQAPLGVSFSDEVALFLDRLSKTDYPNARALIENVVAQDPRPAYYSKEKRQKPFGFCLWDLNIRCQGDDAHVTVMEVSRVR